MIENRQIQDWIDRIDTELVRYFSKKDLSCNPLDRAMEYTLLAGGKRLRPLLTLVTCAELGGDVAQALPFSLASELLHTYSLIHDDLPCMDNDDMRRGKPTNHIVFGEANAILAGDALQAEAFYLLAHTPHTELAPESRIQIIGECARAVGRSGMIAGQVMDLGEAGKITDLDRLKLLHRRKTGCLLRFCIRMGAILAKSNPDQLASLTRYAESIGLLFQVVDDILDEESSSETLGKTAGKDLDQNKATFLKILGSNETHAFADQLLSEALAALPKRQTHEGLLELLAHYIRHREF